MSIPNNYQRAINRKPEPMRVWCKDCRVFHGAGEHISQEELLKRIATEAGEAARDWPGEHDYTGMCSVCQNRFCGNKAQVCRRCCYLCRQQELRERACEDVALAARIHKASAAPETGLERAESVQTLNDSGNAYIDRWLPCIPPTRTAQQKGAFIQKGKNGAKGRIRFYIKDTVKKAAAEFKRILQPICPREPLKGPLTFMVTFVFPWQKSASKKERDANPVPIATRPDASNLAKLIEDVMTEMGFWEDDSQIYDLRVRKFRGNEPGISIRITP